MQELICQKVTHEIDPVHVREVAHHDDDDDDDAHVSMLNFRLRYELIMTLKW